MPTHQPFLTTAQGTHRFACSAVAVQAIIVNADEPTGFVGLAGLQPARRKKTDPPRGGKMLAARAKNTPAKPGKPATRVYRPALTFTS